MTDAPPQEEEEMEMEEGVHIAPKPARGRLSVVSKKYDVDGDGQLDEAEQAMRDMDKSNKGFISNKAIYDLMQDHIKVKEQVFTFKRIIFG